MFRFQHYFEFFFPQFFINFIFFSIFIRKKKFPLQFGLSIYLVNVIHWIRFHSNKSHIQFETVLIRHIFHCYILCDKILVDNYKREKTISINKHLNERYKKNYSLSVVFNCLFHFPDGFNSLDESVTTVGPFVRR